MTASAATSVATLSATQRELVRRILEAAYEVDTVCAARDRDLRDRVGLKRSDNGRSADTTLAAKDVLAVEESIYWLHRDLAELHAQLAPVAIEWISDLPDVAVSAIIRDESANGLVDDTILKRLFERAGMADRFMPIASAGAES